MRRRYRVSAGRPRDAHFRTSRRVTPGGLHVCGTVPRAQKGAAPPVRARPLPNNLDERKWAMNDYRVARLSNENRVGQV